MAGNQIMNAKDVVAAPLAECFITLKGVRYNFMQAKNVEAKMDKTKTEVAILGKTGKGHKATGWSGSGSATFYYNTSIFREVMKEFKENGEDVYFDMQITNYDPTSAVGRQTIILKGCNIDSLPIVKFDAEGEALEDEFDFTFEDWEMPEQFSLLPGMA